MSKLVFPNVLLDLDGTLTDPGLGFIRSITHALETLGLFVPPASELVKFIGPPLEESFHMLTSDGELVAKAMVLYRERYASTGLYENSIYTGVTDALESISESGARIFLATSKPEVFAKRILDHFDLSRFFKGVYGSQLDGTHADKKLLLAHLLEKESISRSDAIMVGDRHHDIDAARVNSVSSLGVTWGYGSESELRSAGALNLISSPAELPTAVFIRASSD